MSERKLSSVSWSEVKKQYPVAKFIHVLPAEDTVFQHGEQNWRLDVTIVDFDPFDEKDVYPIKKRKATAEDAKDGLCRAVQKGQYTNYEPRYIPESLGLTKAALERLLAAAGGSVVPLPGMAGFRVDNRTDPLYADFVAMGVIVSKNGEIRTGPASRDWKGELRKEVKLREATKRFDKAFAQDWDVSVPGVGWKRATVCTPDEKTAAIVDAFEDEWLREREFGPAMAESKAKNRAIRSILALSAKFTLADIKDKSFIVPRWVYEPDISNPEIARLVIAEGLSQQRRGFLLPSVPAPALSPSLPAGTPVETIPALGPGSSEAETVQAEAAEDGEAPALDETRPAADEPFVGAEDADVEPVETEPEPEPEPATDEPDDFDAIADAELSFYVAKMIADYKGDDRALVLKRWEAASRLSNAVGFKELRTILRHIAVAKRKDSSS